MEYRVIEVEENKNIVYSEDFSINQYYKLHKIIVDNIKELSVSELINSSDIDSFPLYFICSVINGGLFIKENNNSHNLGTNMIYFGKYSNDIFIETHMQHCEFNIITINFAMMYKNAKKDISYAILLKFLGKDGFKKLCSINNFMYNINNNNNIIKSYIKTHNLWNQKKLLELYIIELLYMIARDSSNKIEYEYFYKKDIEKTKMVYAFLTSNLDKNFTIEELANIYDISLSTLKRCFKSIYFKPIKTYIREYKIQQACYFLNNTNLKISDISQKLGYKSVSRFCAAFKEIIGKTPIEFKKIN